MSKISLWLFVVSLLTIGLTRSAGANVPEKVGATTCIACHADQTEVGIKYDQTPHVYANNARSLFVNNGNGNFGLSNQLQIDLQNSTNNARAAFSDAPFDPLRIRRD